MALWRYGAMALWRCGADSWQQRPLDIGACHDGGGCVDKQRRAAGFV